MPRPTTWRVRVKRSMEVFVDVEAFSAAGAEVEAGKVPGVTSVFAKSAMNIDQPKQVQSGEEG